MFGSKQGKQERLQRMVEVIRQQGEINHTRLAQALGVNRQTVVKDLVSLHQHGILLCEYKGRLSLMRPAFQDTMPG